MPDVPREVLLLCWRDTGHPQGGGSERYLERIGAELARRGTRVTLRTAAYPSALSREVRDGMTISRSGGRLSVYPRALAAIVAGRFGIGPLAGIRPDVVVDSHNGIPFFAVCATRAQVIVLVHHTHREQWPVAGALLGRIGWLIESRLSPWVHRRNSYVTVSNPSADELYDLGVDRHRVSVIRAGADPVPSLEPTPSLAADTVPSPRLVVLSRLVPHKQIEDALDVIARLAGEYPRLHLDVVGGGWWESRLRTRADELAVTSRVTFHGHVDDIRKHEMLAHADIHLMPSRKEGWGLAVIEAAQHGVPTIGYRASRGLCESIVDGRTGLLVDSVDDMVSATRKLLDDKDFCDSIGGAARRRAATYSWESAADAWLEVFSGTSPADAPRRRAAIWSRR